MKRLTVKEMSLVALFPAMMAATAGLAIPFAGLPAITLQTVFVFLAGLLLGSKLASISMIIYVIMGIIGLPVFSNFQGGLGVITGGHGGFIIGFIFSAYFVGFMKNIKIINNNILYILVVLVGGNLIIYMFGASYIAYLTSTSMLSVLATFLHYIPGDLVKIILVIYVYYRIRSHLTYEGS